MEAPSAPEHHRSTRSRQVRENALCHCVHVQPSISANPLLTLPSPLPTAPAGTDRKEKGAWGENSKRSKHGRVVEKADYRAWNDVEVFDVPSDLRRPDAEAVAEHVKFYGLKELFPGTGLQEKFNSDAATFTSTATSSARWSSPSLSADTACPATASRLARRVTSSNSSRTRSSARTPPRRVVTSS